MREEKKRAGENVGRTRNKEVLEGGRVSVGKRELREQEGERKTRESK